MSRNKDSLDNSKKLILKSEEKYKTKQFCQSTVIEVRKCHHKRFIVGKLCLTRPLK